MKQAKIKPIWFRQYLESKDLVWSKTTKSSETSRLKSVIGHINGDPLFLLEKIKDKKPYTKIIIFLRVIEFVDYLVDKEKLKENLKN